MNNKDRPFSPEERLYALYGRNPPVQALGRLKAERILFRGSRFYDDLLLLSDLRECAKENGTDIGVGGNLGASFTAWLYQCTDTNPLPPHTLCRKCKRSIFSYEGDGWDLPALECCGEPLFWNGSEIPVESLTPRIENPDYQLEIRLAPSFAQQAVEVIREHYREQKCNLVPYTVEFPNRGDLCFVLIEDGKPMPGLESDGLWHTDLEELHASKNRIIKLILDVKKDKIRNYRSKTNLDPSVNDLMTESVLAATEVKIREQILQAGGTLLESDKLCFSSLLNEFGYLHSSHTDDNPVYRQEGAHYSTVLSYREQVYFLIRNALKPEYRLSDELALYITKRTRRGMFTRNRMDPETEQLLRGLEIPESAIEQLKNTLYLPAKADLISMLLDELRLTWYEQHDTAVCHSSDRFMLYDGKVRPSESYLSTHTLPDYSDGDWRNAAYNLNDDEEILHMKRVCQRCGRAFTLQETIREYDSVIDWPNYTENYVGDLCADCAIAEMKSGFTECNEEEADHESLDL